MIKRRFTLLLITILLAVFWINAGKVVDINSKMGLTLASIFDHKGNVIAMSFDDGTIPEIDSTAYPITIRYLGYELLTIDSPIGYNDIALQPIAIELPEFVVSNTDRPILHLVAYMREFASTTGSTDTISVFRESMVDFMIPMKKVKKFKGWKMPRYLAYDTYSHVLSTGGIDSVDTNADYVILFPGFININFDHIDIPKSFNDSSMFQTDTVMGKYYPEGILTKSPYGITCNYDALANQKNHKMSPLALKLLGITADFTDLRYNYHFIPKSTYKLYPTNLYQYSFSLNAIGKGKLYKKAFNSDKPVTFRSYIEVYITERKYLSIERGYSIRKRTTFSRNGKNKSA